MAIPTRTNQGQQLSPPKEQLDSTATADNKNLPKDEGVACSATRRRHAGLDNCKLVFMLWVVLWHTGHMDILRKHLMHKQEPQTTSEYLVMRYWMWTEKVAVPGFCFLSGYFGKGFLQRGVAGAQNNEKQEFRWQKTISMLLVSPLVWHVVRQTIRAMTYRMVKGEWEYSASSSLSSWSPSLDVIEHLMTWYLFALLLWRIWTYVFLSRLRRNPLVVAMCLALLSAYTQRKGPQQLSRRVFFFFPYYVAGLYCDDSTWKRILTWFRCCIVKRFRSHEHSDANNRDDGNQAKQTQPDIDVHLSRYIGASGILVTMLICLVADKQSLSWKYHIDDPQDHLVFFLQYMLAGVAVISTILLVKTIPFSLLPFGHEYSTLAIYESHWIVADFLAWGNLPFTGISMKAWTYNTTFVRYCFSNMSPLVAAFVVHVSCYSICVILGNQSLWKTGLGQVCDPEWAYRWLFYSASCDEKDTHVRLDQHDEGDAMILDNETGSSHLRELNDDEAPRQDDHSSGSESPTLDRPVRIRTLHRHSSENVYKQYDYSNVVD